MDNNKQKYFFFFKSLITATVILISQAFYSNAEEASLATVPKLTNTYILATNNRIIIKYKTNAFHKYRGVQSLASRASFVAGARLNYTRQLGTGAHLMKLDQVFSSETLANQIIEKLNADPEIEYAEFDELLTIAATPDDEQYSQQWHYFEEVAGVNLPEAWGTATRGRDVVVAVLDSGVLPHVDLKDNLLPGYDMITETIISNDGDGRDNDASDPGDWVPSSYCGFFSREDSSSWHGTHVAGTVAAVTNNGIRVAGVAYKAKILPVRVIGRCGGRTSDIADGMVWAIGGTVDGIPVNPNPANVLNMSLGGKDSSCPKTYQDAISQAVNKNVTVVVAGGNYSEDAKGTRPANCDSVIAVAATNRTGARIDISNFEPMIDVAAPGDGILSTFNTGDKGPDLDSYVTKRGTSMATPHVAGIAALLYSVKPDIRPSQVEQALKETARPICDDCGAGIVDAAAAVKHVAALSPITLLKNVPITGISGVVGNEMLFRFPAPAAATNIVFTLNNGTGNADLYMKLFSPPTTTNYGCKSSNANNNEECMYTYNMSGLHYLMVHGAEDFLNATLRVDYDEYSIDKSNLDANESIWRKYVVAVPPGATELKAVLSDGPGDADLYLRHAGYPTRQEYDCRSQGGNNDETCIMTNPRSGWWFIGIHAYREYSGLRLKVTSK